MRDLLRPPVITAAGAEASREGWRADFDGALAAAGGAIDSLDRGLPLNLPVPMPVSQSLGKSMEHPHHGHPMGMPDFADQDAALRIPFAATQRQRTVTR